MVLATWLLALFVFLCRSVSIRGARLTGATLTASHPPRDREVTRCSQQVDPSTRNGVPNHSKLKQNRVNFRIFNNSAILCHTTLIAAMVTNYSLHSSDSTLKQQARHEGQSPVRTGNKPMSGECQAVAISVHLWWGCIWSYRMAAQNWLPFTFFDGFILRDSCCAAVAVNSSVTPRHFAPVPGFFVWKCVGK